MKTIPDIMHRSLTAGQDLAEILYQIPAKKHKPVPSNDMPEHSLKKNIRKTHVHTRAHVDIHQLIRHFPGKFRWAT